MCYAVFTNVYLLLINLHSLRHKHSWVNYIYYTVHCSEEVTIHDLSQLAGKLVASKKNVSIFVFHILELEHNGVENNVMSLCVMTLYYCGRLNAASLCDKCNGKTI